MGYLIQRATFKVSDFLTWNKYEQLILTPKFQRRSVWNDKARSYLIDTIIRELPIPVIVLRDVRSSINDFTPKREVVDGQQRLKTVISFIQNKKSESFKVLGTHNENYKNYYFEDLPYDIQQTVLNYEFFVHVLPSNVSDGEILEIFSRMNSTGVKLNDQELRNASYFGEFKTLAYSLGLKYYNLWHKWRLFTNSKFSRMQEIELINDFLSIIVKGIIRRSPPAINDLYSKYDDEDSMSASYNEIKKRIEFTLIDVIDKLIGNQISKLVYSRKNPLMYALFSFIYDLLYGLHTDEDSDALPLTHRPPNKINKKKLKSILLKFSEDVEANEPKNLDSLKSENQLSDKVKIAYTKSTNNLDNRKIIVNYLKSQYSR